VLNGNPGDQEKPKPIYPLKKQNLNAPNTLASVLHPAKHGQNTRGKVKEFAYEMAKKKEDVKNETMRRATAKLAQENKQDDSMENQEPPDTYGGKEIQESPTDLPTLRKLLKGSIDTDIIAL
jgi:hypothetical protein